MTVFDSLDFDEHERVVFVSDPGSGLQAIIAVHSTVLGPGLGGTRIYPYSSSEAALSDVLRLSRGMTFKAAMAGLDLGGAKGVIIGDPRSIKTERLLRAYGRAVDALCGSFVTAEDVGSTTEDMEQIRKETRWCFGTPKSEGGSGDPSPATARGLMAALRSVTRRIRGDVDLTGLRVAIQGVGKVGYSYAHLLTEERVEIVVADVDDRMVDRAVHDLGAKAVPINEISSVACDVFSPCALGGGLDADTIPQLSCAAIVGSANNQLASDEDADQLAARGILYAPDFVVNAGGLINVSVELEGYSEASAHHRIDGIERATSEVFDRAEADGTTPNRAAMAVASQRIDDVGSLRGFRAAVH